MAPCPLESDGPRGHERRPRRTRPSSGRAALSGCSTGGPAGGRRRDASVSDGAQVVRCPGGCRVGGLARAARLAGARHEPAQHAASAAALNRGPSGARRLFFAGCGRSGLACHRRPDAICRPCRRMRSRDGPAPRRALFGDDLEQAPRPRPRPPACSGALGLIWQLQPAALCASVDPAGIAGACPELGPFRIATCQSRFSAAICAADTWRMLVDARRHARQQGRGCVGGAVLARRLPATPRHAVRPLRASCGQWQGPAGACSGSFRMRPLRASCGQCAPPRPV